MADAIIVMYGRAVTAKDLERFWAKVARRTDKECWLWAAGKDAAGYGCFRFAGSMRGAHRWIYQALNGPLSADIDVCHECDTPACVNPGHLWPGTAADNANDSVKKLRHHVYRYQASRRRLADLMTSRGRDGQPATKIKSDQIPTIKALREQGYSQQAIADMFGVNQVSISAICRDGKRARKRA